MGRKALRSKSMRLCMPRLHSIYEKQTVQRDELRLHSKELIAEIVSRINAGTYDNPKVEELLLRLADRLSKTKGKKVYGYLKEDVKALVDAIVDELAADEKIAALYDLWSEQKEEALQVYTEAFPQRVPLSQNKEFKPIKNAVIQEALGLHADRQDVEEPAQVDAPDPEMPEAPESYSQAGDPIEPDPPPVFCSYFGGWGWKKDTWWTNEYKAARAFLYGTKTSKPDFEQALAGLKEEALRGNGFAMVIHQMLGTRISDTLTLHTNCLSKRNGLDIIRIDQVKTRTFEKPISVELATLIQKAIDCTYDQYGKTEYIFVDAKAPSRPLQYTTIKHKVLRLIKSEDLRDDDGKLFKFSSHMFRRSYGVKLTEMHLDDWTIAKLLGHKNISAVKHYRKMSNQLLAEETRKAREQQTRILLANLDGWGEEYEQIRQDD